MPEKTTSNACDPANALLITIDGPAGSGKTTVSRLLAKRLTYQYVDTGALYRCIAFEIKEAGISPTDDSQLKIFCRDIAISFRNIAGVSRIFSGDRDVTDRLRTPEVTMLASVVSAMPAVREHLLDIQRKLGERKSVVFEGRDMGTVVFPKADIKFYIDANIDVRAQRRHKELPPHTDQTLAAVRNDMQHRDHNDSHRELAPLKPADDAVIINTTHLDIQEVVQVMLDHVRGLSKQGIVPKN